MSPQLDVFFLVGSLVVEKRADQVGGLKTLCIRTNNREPNKGESQEAFSTLDESSSVFFGDSILDTDWLMKV